MGGKLNGAETLKKPAPKIPKHAFTSESFETHSEEGQAGEWRKYLIIEEPPEEPVLIRIGNAPVCTPYNHSLVIGKKKSRKSLFLTYLISLYTGDLSTDILVCDTEQGKKHVWKHRDRIYRLTGAYVDVLSLRGLSPSERKAVIKEAVEAGKYKIVIIDGIRDLLSNINDADQCTELITWVESLTVNHGLHIINVLHQNKTDNNARGHIGSELLNKAEMTIEIELDEKANCSMVKCESSRDIPFESFAFTHNEASLPEVVSVPIKGQTMTDEERKTLLVYVFEDEQLRYADLLEGIKIHFKVGNSRAEQLIGEFKRLQWIINNGKPRSKDAVYKLIAKPQTQTKAA